MPILELHTAEFRCPKGVLSCRFDFNGGSCCSSLRTIAVVAGGLDYGLSSLTTVYGFGQLEMHASPKGCSEAEMHVKSRCARVIFSS